MNRIHPVLTITTDPENEFALVVAYHEPNLPEPVASETVDLSPSPTWPSPSEQSDMIADAVRRVWDKSWTYYSGEEVVR